MTNNPQQPTGQETTIERPEITVAQIVLLILAQKGKAAFSELVVHPLTRALGVRRTENSFYTALSRLQRRRQVARRPDRTYELLPGGEFAALKAFVRKEFTELERSTREDAPARRWDGRWRLVFFDIPETKRPLRDYIRSVLKRLGCREFQRSMWIYPHKFPPFILRTFDDPQIRKYARLITTYDIDYEEDLRRMFKLA